MDCEHNIFLFLDFRQTLITAAHREVIKVINNTIERELDCLRPKAGRKVKAHDFTRNCFENKTDYLISIGNGKRLTNYLAPSLRKEICAAQEELKLEQQTQNQGQLITDNYNYL